MTPVHPHLLPPATPGTAESGCGGNRTQEHYSAPTFHHADVGQLYPNAPKLPPTSKWSPCWYLECWSSQLMAPVYYNVRLSLSQRQGRATINAKTLTLYLLKFTKSSGDGGLYCTRADRHTNRHRHMLERVSLPFESVCWNQRRNQRYDNLAAKPRRQTFSSLGCSTHLVIYRPCGHSTRCT